MKGLVLAGGAGTRLRPLTHTSAKQLVPVANVPILFYGLRQLADAGLTDVGVIVGDTRHEVEAAVGDGSRFGLRVTYIRQPEPRGIAHALLTAADFIAGEDVVLFLGDNLIEGGLRDLIAEFRTERPAASILLKRVTDPGRFGVASLGPSGDVVALSEKPDEPASDLALVGVYLFGPEIFGAARAIAPSARGELEITDAIQHLIDAGHPVRATELTGWWLDTGKKDDLLDANRVLLEGLVRRIDGRVDAASTLIDAVVVEAGAVVIGSTIQGPAIVGARSRVVDSRIGPFTSIGEDCQLERAELTGSVVLERCELCDVAGIEDSLLGRDVRVTSSDGRPGSLRLLLGDHSELGV